MRLGLLGGTFDPVHMGHLVLAEICREACELDELWFVPTGNPPHKKKAGISSAKARTEMLELAVAGHKEFSVRDIETKRQGTTYTVDTLQDLANEEADRELFFLIGTDSLHDFMSWREPERIAELATIVVVNRGGEVEPDLSVLPAEIANKFVVVSIPDVAFSSSEIRSRIQLGKSIRFMVPRAVEAYIQQHELYS